MSDGLELDFETRSPQRLGKHPQRVSIYRYFEDPRTDVMMAAFSLYGRPIKTWTIGQPCPPEIEEAAADGLRVYAHNAGFERRALTFLAERSGWPAFQLEQFYCTATMAAAMALPRDLDRLARALGVAEQKDSAGHDLMMKLAVPKKVLPDGTCIWNEDPADLARELAYCVQDVKTEAACLARLFRLTPIEQERYWLSERINDRGIRVDVSAAAAAIKIVEAAQVDLAGELAEITGGVVTAATQVQRIKEWIQGEGVDVTTLGKMDIEDWLSQSDLPGNVRRVLEIRQEGGRTSTGKLDAMIRFANDDGRVRGEYLFNGATTRRFTAGGVQVQNFPRGTGVVKRTTVAVADIRTGDLEWMRLCYGNAIGAVSDSLRSFIMAENGHDLIAADYANIEGRCNAWLADEEWKLQAFRDYDTFDVDPFTGDVIADAKGKPKRLGPDLYHVMAAEMFGVEIADVTGEQRQVGKVGDLGCGYQGGVGAFHSFAKIYKLDMALVYRPLWERADEDTRKKVVERYAVCLKRGNSAADVLSREQWIASELTKRAWRRKHSRIVDLWAALDDAIWEAVENPGMAITVAGGRITYKVTRGFLVCQLPSGGHLFYGKPEVQSVVVPWADRNVPMRQRERKPSVTYLATDPKTKAWRRFPMYGGLADENCVQAICRDVLMTGIENLEAAGYPVVMHSHDEAVAEIPKNWGDLDEYKALMCRQGPWTAGWPIAAAGWRGKRNRKD